MIEGNQLLSLINRLRGAFLGRDEWFYSTPVTATVVNAFAAATWYDAILAGDLIANALYQVQVVIDTHSAGEPYYMSAAGLYRTTITNAAGTVGPGVTLLTATHTETTSANIEVRSVCGLSQISSGLQFKTNVTCPASTTATVSAYLLRG